jgi:hypothetical protein
MLFIAHFEGYPSVSAADVAKRIRKIKATRKGGPKVIGAWFTIEKPSGYAVVEADDAAVLAVTMIGWNDLVRFTLTPVLSADQFLAMAELEGASPERPEE